MFVSIPTTARQSKTTPNIQKYKLIINSFFELLDAAICAIVVELISTVKLVMFPDTVML